MRYIYMAPEDVDLVLLHDASRSGELFGSSCKLLLLRSTFLIFRKTWGPVTAYSKVGPRTCV